MLLGKHKDAPTRLFQLGLFLLYSLGFLSIFGASVVSAKDEPKAQPQPGDSQLEQRLTELFDSAYIPGASVVVLKGGEVVHAQVYGYADKSTERRVTPDTVFEAASLSKALFAPIVLQLVEEKLLQLDRPLYQYFDQPLPEIEGYANFNDDERYQLLTARHVLSHTTGLPNWRSHTDGHLIFKSNPGETFTYSGEGFELLQRTVEHITEKSLEQLGRERIFTPLGMKHSSYTHSEEQAKTSAQGHLVLGKVWGKRAEESGSSAYSLHTNAVDYAKFMQAIIKNELLDTASHRAFLSPQSRIFREFNDTDMTLYWGLGISVEPRGDQTYFWHGGSNMNFKALALAELSTGDGVIFFANSDLGEFIFPELISAALPDFGLSQNFKLAAFSDARFTDKMKLALALTHKPFEQATKAYRNTANQLSLPLDDLNEIAEQLSWQSYFDEAQLLVDEIVSSHSNQASAQFMWGKVALRKGEVSEAKTAFERALTLDPKYEDANIVLQDMGRITHEGGVEFVLDGHTDSHLVTLAGSFNEWRPLTLPMKKTESGWKINLPLPDGEHFYKFVVDGNWIFDPANPERGEYGGVMNSMLKVE